VNKFDQVLDTRIRIHGLHIFVRHGPDLVYNSFGTAGGVGA
jgi:hypothetical protein